MAGYAVVAELKDGSARKVSLEMLAEARRLAGDSGGEVAAIALGALAPGEAERLASYGADTIVHVAELAGGDLRTEVTAAQIRYLRSQPHHWRQVMGQSISQ